MLVNGVGGVAGHHSGADFLGLESADLRVHRADLGPLLIRQCRHIHCAGEVIERVFGGRTHVDHGVKPVVQ